MVAGRAPHHGSPDNPIQFDPTGQELLVNEVFYSLQGEGWRVGRPTVFIRLAKCNMACAFCDTEYETYEKLTVEEVLRRVRESMELACYRAEEKVLVDITGGEPLLQNFAPLVIALRKLGFKDIGVETSGTVWNDAVQELNWITCSPKVPLRKVPSELVPFVNEWKWIVDRTFIAQYGIDKESVYVPTALNYLQPESGKSEFVKYAVDLCLKEPGRYKLSLQTHKVARIP
jgi:organic radical activating enzyme